MSILVSGIILPWDGTEAEAAASALKKLGLRQGRSAPVAVHKLSFDFRHGTPSKIYSMEVFLGEGEAELVEKRRDPQIRLRASSEMPQPTGSKQLENPPVIVGFGPAGMFAALVLAKNGYRPIVLERGDSLENRDKKVDAFFNGGPLDTQSNIQFGEGGAGAYSDGKLTTRINDPLCEAVLDELVAHGAPAEILKNAHPHIGTDRLKSVVKAIREEIRALGGEVHFNAPVRDFVLQNGKITAVCTDLGEIAASQVILATGHSARDTVQQLLARGVSVLPKSFAMGVRIEHLQREIDACMFGRYAGDPRLGAAEYAVSHREGERGCFSFCMCPGGYVMAAASEAETVVTNGMSRHARDGQNGNAAIAISVDSSAFGNDPLGGMALARSIEQRAFAAGGSDYSAPAQLVGDFLENRPSTKVGRVQPTYPLGVRLDKIDPFLPGGASELLRTSLARFAGKHRFFADRDAVLTAPETRTSSPVRIPRGENFSSVSVQGLYPCGEGAGYAGGIMSAAVDGIKVACAVLSQCAANVGK